MRPAAALLFSVLACGCGRTEVVRYTLEPPDAGFDAGVDAGVDAGIDAGVDAGFDAGPCVPREVPLVPALPTAMLVIDRSGSMDQDLDGRDDGGVNSRWRVLESSLTTVLPPLDTTLALGALMYPVPGQSCSAPSGVDLSPAVGNARPVLSLFTSSSPLGGTPTASALAVAAQHLRGLRTATSAKALILATDGAPNCNAQLNNRTCTCTSPPLQNPNCDAPTHCLDDSSTLLTLNSLFRDQALPTYVIGLGSSLNEFASTLDQMAVAGGAPRMGAGPRYYSAANQQELTEAFTRIAAQLTRCTFLVSGLSPTDTFVVQVGGQDVPEGPGGWEWRDMRNGELGLSGIACDQAAGGATARVLVDCR